MNLGHSRSDIESVRRMGYQIDVVLQWKVAWRDVSGIEILSFGLALTVDTMREQESIQSEVRVFQEVYAVRKVLQRVIIDTDEALASYVAEGGEMLVNSYQDEYLGLYDGIWRPWRRPEGERVNPISGDWQTAKENMQ